MISYINNNDIKAQFLIMRPCFSWILPTMFSHNGWKSFDSNSRKCFAFFFFIGFIKTINHSHSFNQNPDRISQLEIDGSRNFELLILNFTTFISSFYWLISYKLIISIPRSLCWIIQITWSVVPRLRDLVKIWIHNHNVVVW